MSENTNVLLYGLSIHFFMLKQKIDTLGILVDRFWLPAANTVINTQLLMNVWTNHDAAFLTKRKVSYFLSSVFSFSKETLSKL